MFTERYRALRREGLTIDDALAVLRRANAHPIDCIKAIRAVEGVGLGDAKGLFSQSPSWADVVEATDVLHRELEALFLSPDCGDEGDRPDKEH